MLYGETDRVTEIAWVLINKGGTRLWGGGEWSPATFKVDVEKLFFNLTIQS